MNWQGYCKMYKKTALILLLAICALTSACIEKRAILWNSFNATPSSIAAEKAAIEQPAKPAAIIPIYVVTSRQPQNDLSLPFNSKRSTTLHYAQVNVGIPEQHKEGYVETNGYKPDPAKHFAATAMRPYQNRSAFKAELNSALARFPKGKREVLLFIHGYNNNFADSTFRAAQIAHDFKLNTVVIHYSWPSGGSIGLYVYDRDSADFARTGLADLLTLVSETNADQINVLAHSMGNYVTMEALRTLALKGQRRPIDRISGLLMAAPDIDMDVFERQYEDIKKLPSTTAVLVSHKDAALKISGTLTGGHARVGDGSSIETLNKNGIIVLDMSNVDGGSHNVFASSPTLMALIQDGSLSKSVLKGDGETPTNAILADGTSAVKGTASFILYTPIRLLRSVGNH